MDRHRAARDGCDNLQRSVKDLLASVEELSPDALVTAGGDPDGSRRLCVLSERFDDCLARYDALQRTLGLPTTRDPGYGRFRSGGSPVGRLTSRVTGH